jgi:FtsP/CotA-like multicopper oxidase with cupredoxin domain
MMVTPDSVLNAFAQDHAVNFDGPPVGRRIFTINGRSWPNTERVAANAGDTLHWRIINATSVAHPMHLHGFYYRVDALWSPSALPAEADARGRMVVTQLLNPFSTMSMTWSPNRPGNWIFHCHFAIHLMPDSISASADDPHMRGMVGLILGINVAERPGARSAGAPLARRRLRLDAVADSSSPDDRSKPAPTMHFVLEENGRRVAAGPAFSPEIGLTRGEPVSIMVVNHLADPTSVHWHGIELEDSYVDGVPGVSGAGQRLAPMVAPGDSFEARFTPPRSGTFMYHAHVDEVRQQEAGLEGALIVRDPGVVRSTDDQVFFIKGSRFGGPKHRGRPEVNGQMNPDTVVLHVGRPARFRILSLATNSPVPIASLTTRPDSAPILIRDTLLAQWRPVAKDGADLPAGEQRTRPAQFVISIGETYDFEFTPERRGHLRFELRANLNGTLLARVPIRVE